MQCRAEGLGRQQVGQTGRANQRGGGDRGHSPSRPGRRRGRGSCGRRFCRRGFNGRLRFRRRFRRSAFQHQRVRRDIPLRALDFDGLALGDRSRRSGVQHRGRQIYLRGFGFRAIVGGVAYYIGTKRYSSEVLVLDGESMNLCRSKKVRQLVENAHTWHTGRRYVVDAIAYREALPETDPERVKLPKLRDQLAEGDAAQPKEIAAVIYEIPQIPCLTVAEVLAARKENE